MAATRWSSPSRDSRRRRLSPAGRSTPLGPGDRGKAQLSAVHLSVVQYRAVLDSAVDIPMQVLWLEVGLPRTTMVGQETGGWHHFENTLLPFVCKNKPIYIYIS
jgi:hypothetical protein